MDPGRAVVLAVIAFAIFLGWRFSRGGSGGVPVYVVAAVVLGSLVGAAVAELLQAERAAEALNVVAISLSLAALAGSEGLWVEQMRADLERTRLYHVVHLEDFLSWRGWLKLVDRVGALRGALCYLALFAVAMAMAVLADWYGRPEADRGFAFIALVFPLLFALLSTRWIYHGARRLIPGA